MFETLLKWFWLMWMSDRAEFLLKLAFPIISESCWCACKHSFYNSARDLVPTFRWSKNLVSLVEQLLACHPQKLAECVNLQTRSVNSSLLWTGRLNQRKEEVKRGWTDFYRRSGMRKAKKQTNLSAKILCYILLVHTCSRNMIHASVISFGSLCKQWTVDIKP